MTRINVGVLPKELSKQHILAEHREIVRIPNCILKGRFSMKNCPETFTLNTGHVKFFYNKLLFLYERYVSIYENCIEREYNVQDYSSSFIEAMDKYPMLANNYIPTLRDRELLLERIRIRTEESKIKKQKKRENKL